MRSYYKIYTIKHLRTKMKSLMEKTLYSRSQNNSYTIETIFFSFERGALICKSYIFGTSCVSLVMKNKCWHRSIRIPKEIDDVADVGNYSYTVFTMNMVTYSYFQKCIEPQSCINIGNASKPSPSKIITMSSYLKVFCTPTRKERQSSSA